jgi:tRNA(Ile)-lysidine synthetase-like protein
MVVGGWLVHLERVNAHAPVTASSNDATNVYKPFIRDTLSFDTIIPYKKDRTLIWRSRREGDVLLLRGKHHKLRKLQNERGIPSALRERLPLLCDAEGIYWAPGIGLRDSAPTTSPDGYLQLSITPVKT